MSDKLSVCNDVLALFAPDTRIELVGNRVYVVWKTHSSQLHGVTEEIRRAWLSKNGSFYPVWCRRWPHGGTATTALAQLVRWLRNKPTLPIASWRYWASDRCRLVPTKAVGLLLAGGYPTDCRCVLCGRDLTVCSFDWWSLAGVEGTCCSMMGGCRQTSRVQTFAERGQTEGQP